MWYLYLLWHSGYERTYIGVTTDLDRRIRQHNKEIKGGAKSTSKYAPGWEIYSIVCGFEDRSTVMRWEKIIKSRERGLYSRDKALENLEKRICPPGKQYEVPERLKYSYVEILA